MSQEKIWYLVSKKLSGEASAEELAELEVLLRSDADTHYAIQNITDVWQLPVRPSEQAEEAYKKHLERLKQQDPGWILPPGLEMPGNTADDAPVRNRKLLWLALTVITIVVAAGFYFLYAFRHAPAIISHRDTPADNNATDKNVITTRYGSKTKITLPDGSQVWLNAGSNLRYDKKFDNEVREVELSGEAFFDVVKNPEHPFIIHTHNVDVKVLGTAFDVKSYPGERKTETSLIRGRVEITIRNRPDEKYILKPNEKLVVMDDHVVTPGDLKGSDTLNEPIVSLKHLTYQPLDSTVVETAWVQNKLIFNNESFQDIAAKMQRWYGVDFEFRDPDKEQLHLTATFTNETIEQALNALRITAPFHYLIQHNKVIITK